MAGLMVDTGHKINCDFVNNGSGYCVHTLYIINMNPNDEPNRPSPVYSRVKCVESLTNEYKANGEIHYDLANVFIALRCFIRTTRDFIQEYMDEDNVNIHIRLHEKREELKKYIFDKDTASLKSLIEFYIKNNARFEATFRPMFNDLRNFIDMGNVADPEFYNGIEAKVRGIEVSWYRFRGVVTHGKRNQGMEQAEKELEMSWDKFRTDLNDAYKVVGLNVHEKSIDELLAELDADLASEDSSDLDSELAALDADAEGIEGDAEDVVEGDAEDVVDAKDATCDDLADLYNELDEIIRQSNAKHGTRITRRY